MTGLLDLPLLIQSEIKDWEHITRYDFETGQPLEGVRSPWVIEFYDPDTGKPWKEARLLLWGPRRLVKNQHSAPEWYKIFGDPRLLIWFEHHRYETRRFRWWRKLW